LNNTRKRKDEKFKERIKMNKIQIQLTGKPMVCDFHSTVPETVNGNCLYCESVERR
jgi:hypothetical protein